MDAYCTNVIYDCPKDYISSAIGCISIEDNKLDSNIFDFQRVGSSESTEKSSNIIIQNQSSSDTLIELIDAMIYSLVDTLEADKFYLLEFGRNNPENSYGDFILYSIPTKDTQIKTTYKFGMFYLLTKANPSKKEFSFGYYPLLSNPTYKTIKFETSSNSNVVKLPRIETQREGYSCRRWLNENNSSDTDLLNDMGTFCNNNKDLDTCKTFCNNKNYNSYCGMYNPILLYLSFAISLLILFGSIVVYLRNRDKTILLVGGIFVLSSLVIFGWQLYRYLTYTGGFDGSKTDSDNKSETLFDKVKPSKEVLNQQWKTPLGVSTEAFVLIIRERQNIKICLNKNLNTDIWNKENSCVYGRNSRGFVWDPINAVFIEDETSNYITIDGDPQLKKIKVFSSKLNKTIEMEQFDSNELPDGICCNKGSYHFQKQYYPIMKTTSDSGKKADGWAAECTFPQYWDPSVPGCVYPVNNKCPPMMSDCCDGSSNPKCSGYQKFKIVRVSTTGQPPNHFDGYCKYVGYTGSEYLYDCNIPNHPLYDSLVDNYSIQHNDDLYQHAKYGGYMSEPNKRNTFFSELKSNINNIPFQLDYNETGRYISPDYKGSTKDCIANWDRDECGIDNNNDGIWYFQ
jgi:hypothetical protein